MPGWFAVIRSRSPRYDRWLRGFGSDSVPIVSPDPVACDLVGTGEQVPCYMLDLGRFGPDRLDRLVAFLAETFGDDPISVRAEVAAKGIPIIAEDVTLGDSGAMRERYRNSTLPGPGRD